MSESEASMERRLVGLFTDLGALTMAHERGVTADAFEEPVNGAIYSWCVEYWLDAQMRQVPTLAALNLEFPGVAIPAVVEESADFLVGLVQRRYVVRQAQRILTEAVNDLETDPVAVMSKLSEQSFRVSESVAPRNMRVDLSLNADERHDRYRRRAEQVDTGIGYGLTELDTHTQGVRPGELAVVAGYTKVGKSWFLVKAAVEARRAGFRPLLVTLELGVDEMSDRIDAAWAGVSYYRFSRGELDPMELHRMQEARQEIADAGGFHIEKPQMGERTVRNIVNRARQLGADLLLVDQLSFLDGEREYSGDRATTQKHSDIIFSLKDEINRESVGKVPCILAVQFNRESQRSNDGRGALFNLANTASIEQTADIIMGLWRNNEMRANNSMGLSILGSRRSDLADWMLTWRLTDRTEIRIRELMVATQ
ncbi:DnaB-like dsDNA helicase [Gordonia phage Skog]|uniref:DnaB-like dsDNA helicase n=1 Tax=Gordonia phage Skog TaxID=2704033 RepID=A0A6G6XJR9_9CAUD|nr:DnaB-like dsDNA helicase [Gordonia phage Skog]QIG58359.1 DnaB-like dsDNA helicase [Gordonia phage Skog]